MSGTVMSENYWRINPQVTKNSLFMATHVLFHFLHAFLLLNHRQTDENSHWSIAVPLLFTVGHSVAVLWCHTSTYCDVILSDCPQNISKWVTYIFPPSSSSLYPPLQRSWKGVYWFLLVRLSVRLWTESCLLCIFNNTRRIHFIFAHLIKQLQKVCHV